MIVRLLISLALLLSLAAPPAAAGDVRSCAVDEISGAGARIWNQGAWSALRVSMEVPAGTKIATDPDARVRLVCGGANVITIGSATEINLEELALSSGPRRNVVLQLVQGIVGIFAPERAWDRFEVRTPVAIASVRSTKWLMEHDRADGAAVFVRTGRVAVDMAGGRQALLGPGEGVSVSASGDAGEVKTWGQARIARSMAALGFDWR